MKKISLLFIFVLLFTACASKTPSVNYYTLSSYSEKKNNLSEEFQRENVSVIITYLPHYLDKNQIAFRTPNSINVKYNDSELWAEPVRQGMSRVIVEVLNSELAPKAGAVIYRSAKAKYRLSVEISKFEGNVNDFAELEAFWQLQSNEKVLSNGLYRESLPTSELVGSLVEAESRLLIDFATKLSQEIKGII